MNKPTQTILLTLGLMALAITVPLTASRAQSSDGDGPTFNEAAGDLQQRLDASLKELSDLRQRIADQQVPLSRKLSQLERELSEVRGEFEQTSRTLDNRTLDVSNLKKEIEARKQEGSYISNLLGEYIRNLESRLHIAETQRYADPLEAAKLAPENNNLAPRQVYETQAELLEMSLDRIAEMIGGTRFRGTAVDPGGTVQPGAFFLLGPTAIFKSDDGSAVGTAEQRLGSVEPAVLTFDDPKITETTAALVDGDDGRFPLDPSLGNAHKMEETEETILEHVQKGGPVVYPILGLAAASLLVALFKWIGLTFVRKPSRKRIDLVLDSIAAGKHDDAQRRVEQVPGPVGAMLKEGVANLDKPRELIEETMFEKLLATRLKLQRFLPFIAITAAASPLLGLLGTVTGIIETFRLITVFGTGDVKTLSGGISQALITTELGLIVAIPSLLLHAFLSRKAKGIVDQMEKAAVALMNQIGKAHNQSPEPADKAA